MTIPGRRPKPTNLKILEGNPGKRPLNINEPKPKSIAPKCPNWLLDDAKKEWERLAPELEKPGLITRIDKIAFACLCQCYAKLKVAEKFIKKFGTTYRYKKKDKNGKTISVYHAPYPEVAIANQCLKQIRAFCVEFGLTPSSRGRIYLPSEVPLDEEFEALLD